ncbi:DUF4844 domain-containing protein [Flavobacterium sp. RHBU_24]|uniref:DUF4844 domain-containing protein n=1 Tax=Flavobacterium sp. RHBU_24 TaxID=3391185 RepID=UPI003984EA81
MTKFEAFKSKEKFIKDATSYYPGAQNEQIKKQLTERINLAADDFAQVASGNEPTEKAYQEAIGKGLDRFSDIYLNIDTEDRERVCTYFEELMDIVGLESSDGQLSDFMYK